LNPVEVTEGDNYLIVVSLFFTHKTLYIKLLQPDIGKEYVNNDDPKQQSNTKIVFKTDDIYMLRDMLVFQNVQVAEIKTFENYDYWICDGADPEGNIFQLKQKKQGATY